MHNYLFICLFYPLEPQGCQFRSRQVRSVHRYHRHVQVVSNVTTREACETACLHFAPFSCRSYQFGGAPAVCLLSPEDSSSEVGMSVSPVKLQEHAGDFPGTTYFEKESCIEGKYVEIEIKTNIFAHLFTIILAKFYT